MIWHRRLVLHAELHRGYAPRFSVRWEPRAGTRVVDGGEAGVLVRCHECGGSGLLHRPDRLPPMLLPTEDGGA